MDQGTEPIKQDIDSIRDSMTNKVEQIEAKVKDTVENTVDTVKRTFDVKQQVSEHPWTALGASLLAGYVLGSMGDSDDRSSYSYRPGEPMRYYPESGPARPSTPDYSQEHHERAQMYQMGSSAQQRSDRGFLSDIMDQFGDELETVKTAAITAAVTMLRDTIKQSLPQFYEEYERVRNERQGTADSDTSHYRDQARSTGMRERALGATTDTSYAGTPTGTSYTGTPTSASYTGTTAGTSEASSTSAYDYNKRSSST